MNLAAEDLTLAYDADPVVHSLSLRIRGGEVTSIVGANACGKSTLLRGLARLLKPAGGTVLLDSQPIFSMRSREVALELGILPQTPIAPEGLTVQDLVARGRYPHQGWLNRWTREDEKAVEEALALTGVGDLRDRPVDSLSGGQRQRTWIAMALAQDTPIMLLDEPTTYLDLAHQIEVLDVLAELNDRSGRTIIMVLHELNQAARYSDRVVAMRSGRIFADGHPRDIVNAEMIREVYGLEAVVVEDPLTGLPMCVPCGRTRMSARAAVPPA